MRKVNLTMKENEKYSVISG